MSSALIPYFLYAASFLFCCGLYVVVVKRSAVYVLIGVELMLNAGTIVLATFSQLDPNLSGQIFGIFAITLTVCEVAIALAILLNIYRKTQTSSLEDLQQLSNES